MNVAPIYVACDAGLAMDGARSISLHEAFHHLFDDLVTDPFTDQRTRISLTYFNDGVITYMPLKQPSTIWDFPSIPSASGATSYSPLMNFLGEVIEQEMPDLLREGEESDDPFSVVRPLLIMIAAGKDTGNLDHHSGTFAESSRFRPNVIALDLSGDVAPSLRQLSPIGANWEMVYSVEQSTRIELSAELVKGFLRGITHSITSGIHKAPDGTHNFRFPDFPQLKRELIARSTSSIRNTVENNSIRSIRPVVTHAIGGPGPGPHESPVYPIYIVFDEGSALSADSISAINDGLEELLETLVDDPVIDQYARVSIIAFNDAAQVLLPLTMASNVTDIPQCAASGSTDYSSAFRLVKARIVSDMSALQSEARDVQRPLLILRPWVIFMAGAASLETWEIAYKDLVSPENEYRPIIMTFGVAGAQKEVMLKIATTPFGLNKPLAFQATPGYFREAINFVRYCYS